MSDGINKAESWTTSRSRSRDSGTTFVELLISIVLLGIGVLAVLTASRAAIIGSTTERDHSKAHEWLQSAGEVVADSAELAWLDCDLPLDGEQIRASYEASLRGEGSIVPETWDSSRIAIPDAVTFAQPSGDYGSTCFDAIDRQLITIEVSDPEGEIIERVQIVKAAP